MSRFKIHDINKVHPKNLQKGTSDCCGGKFGTIPACFGDPQMTLCLTCNTECKVIWKPMYENVGQGTWRLIEHKPFGHAEIVEPKLLKE